MSAAALKALKYGISFFKKVFANSEESKLSLQKFLAFFVGIFFFLILIPVAALSLPGFIGKEIVRSDKSDFSLTDSKTYKKIEKVYSEYVEDLDAEVASRIEKIRESNKKAITVVDEKTGETTTTFEYPEIITDISFNKPSIEFVLAYISTKYLDVQEENTYKFNKKEIKKFLKDTTSIEEHIQGSDPIYFTVYTIILSPEEIANLYFTNDEVDKYLFSYESFGGISGELNQDIAGEEIYDIDMSETTQYADGMKIPHYLQYDKKWGNIPYGNRTISWAGCGPTCLAMVISYLNNRVVLPFDVSNWSQTNGYYVNGVGSSWSLYSGAATHWKLKSYNIGKNSAAVVEALQAGKPVIASMAPGTFTKGGHFIVLRGITADKKILVNDPNDNFHTKNFYKKSFDLSLIMRESKKIWSFSK